MKKSIKTDVNGMNNLQNANNPTSKPELWNSDVSNPSLDNHFQKEAQRLLRKYSGIVERTIVSFKYHYDRIQDEFCQACQNLPEDEQELLYDILVEFMEAKGSPYWKNEEEFIQDFTH